MGRGLTGCRKIQIEAAFSSTATLSCAGFAALIIDAKPRVPVLLDIFRNLFTPGLRRRSSRKNSEAPEQTES